MTNNFYSFELAADFTDEGGLAGPLAEGLGAETADSVESEAEKDAVLFAQAHVEG